MQLSVLADTDSFRQRPAAVQNLLDAGRQGGWPPP